MGISVGGASLWRGGLAWGKLGLFSYSDHKTALDHGLRAMRFVHVLRMDLEILKITQFGIVILCPGGAAVGLVCVLAGARYARLSSRPQAQAGCRWLGAFSYPCYILYIPLLLILNSTGDALFSEFSKNHPSWLTFGRCSDSWICRAKFGAVCNALAIKVNSWYLSLCSVGVAP